MVKRRSTYRIFESTNQHRKVQAIPAEKKSVKFTTTSFRPSISYITQVVTDFFRSVPKAIVTVPSSLKHTSSLVARKYGDTFVTPGLVSPSSKPELKSHLGLPPPICKEEDDRTLCNATEEPTSDDKCYITYTDMTPDAVMNIKSNLNNPVDIFGRMIEMEREKSALQYGLKLFKTETNHQIEKLEGEIEGFEEEIASRDHQILEQEEQILEQNERIMTLNEILQEKEGHELELEEAERTLMNAVFDLITQRTTLKRRRDESEEDEMLRRRWKRDPDVEG